MRCHVDGTVILSNFVLSVSSDRGMSETSPKYLKSHFPESTRTMSEETRSFSNGVFESSSFLRYGIKYALPASLFFSKTLKSL